MAQESDLEKSFVGFVEGHGGITAKMTIKGRRGWPDRLYVLPGGRIGLAELKHPDGTGRRSGTQIALHAALRHLGVIVRVIDSKDQFAAILEKHT